MHLETDLANRGAELNWEYQFFGLDALKTAAILSLGNLEEVPYLGPV
jgi:hypothetical protein